MLKKLVVKILQFRIYFRLNTLLNILYVLAELSFGHELAHRVFTSSDSIGVAVNYLFASDL